MMQVKQTQEVITVLCVHPFLLGTWCGLLQILHVVKQDCVAVAKFTTLVWFLAPEFEIL